MADKYNIGIEQGATFALNLQWIDSNEDPIDITGFTAKMQIRERYGSPVIIELSTSNGRIVLTNPTNGEFSLNISASVTNDLTSCGCSCGVYDLELTSPSSVITRLVEGKVNITPQVTV